MAKGGGIMAWNSIDTTQPELLSHRLEFDLKLVVAQSIRPFSEFFSENSGVSDLRKQFGDFFRGFCAGFSKAIVKY